MKGMVGMIDWLIDTEGRWEKPWLCMYVQYKGAQATPAGASAMAWSIVPLIPAACTSVSGAKIHCLRTSLSLLNPNSCYVLVNKQILHLLCPTPPWLCTVTTRCGNPRPEEYHEGPLYPLYFRGFLTGIRVTGFSETACSHIGPWGRPPWGRPLNPWITFIDLLRATDEAFRSPNHCSGKASWFLETTVVVHDW